MHSFSKRDLLPRSYLGYRYGGEASSYCGFGMRRRTVRRGMNERDAKATANGMKGGTFVAEKVGQTWDIIQTG